MASPSRIFLVFLVLLYGVFATNYETVYSCERAFKKTSSVPKSHTSSLRRSFFQLTNGATVTPDRSLLQTVSCEWDAEEDECELSDAALATLLLDSTSPLGRFLGQIIACSAQVRKSTCIDVGYCVWNRPECTYADFSIGNEDSPCVKHAPGIFNFLAARTQCEAHKNRIVCEAPICQWDNEESICEADIVETFFAFEEESDSEDAEELLDDLEGEGDRKFLSTVLECSGVNNRTSCTGDCVWDSMDESCDATAQTVVKSVIPANNTSDDGLCQYFEFMAQSSCFSYDLETECVADDSCQYDNGCLPDTVPLVNRIIEEDVGFVQSLLRASARCGRSETPSTCS